MQTLFSIFLKHVGALIVITLSILSFFEAQSSTSAPPNENPIKYTVETEEITLKNPSRKGYEFKGWFLEPTFETEVNADFVPKNITVDYTPATDSASFKRLARVYSLNFSIGVE